MLRSGRTIRTTGGSSRLPMEILGFDSVINRRGTGSVKYDAILKRGYPESVLPLWIADMDFQTAHPILRAMQDRLNHGIFGYDEPSEAYFEAIMGWWADYHRYELRRDWILASPGVMFSLSLAIRAFTSPGDAVMIQTPVYYPFFKAVEANNRRLVTCPLLYSNKSYSIDFDEFQNTIQAQDVKAFILCNPHNPVGRVWTPLELEKMGSICLRSGVIVLSDEIHCDITAPDHKHTVFAGVNSRIEQITATLTSPSKTFNLPGFHASHIFIANRAMRQAWMNEKTATCVGAPDAMGIVACQAAYENGRDWLERLKVYINGNDAFVREFVRQYIPGVSVADRQGTYLLWLDCWGLGFTPAELNRRLIDRGRVWLSDGGDFGEEGEGFLRLNLACPREILAEAMMRIVAAVSR